MISFTTWAVCQFLHSERSPPILMRFCSAACLLSIMCVFAPEQAWAKPKSTTFEEVIESSAIIAVAKFADKDPDFTKDALDLQILQNIKGDLKLGKHRISFEDKPRFANKGDTFIVFLDAGKAWRFVAHPLNGNKLEQDLLQIVGFFDAAVEKRHVRHVPFHFSAGLVGQCSYSTSVK